jgi:hypothetical protein
MQYFIPFVVNIEVKVKTLNFGTFNSLMHCLVQCSPKNKNKFLFELLLIHSCILFERSGGVNCEANSDPNAKNNNVNKAIIRPGRTALAAKT